MTCILFLVIQAVRTVVLGQPEELKPSALERAVSGGEQVTLTGTVERVEEKEKVTAVFLRDNAVSVDGQITEESHILVYIRKNNNPGEEDTAELCPAPGNIVRVSGETQLFESARNPGNFDQKFYYQKQGIHVLVWAEELHIISAETDRLQVFLSDLRSRWKELLLRHLGEYYGGTMSAILLGEKSGMDDGMKKLYQKNGISHILTISGLHMSFIGMGLYSMLRRMGFSFAPAGIAGGTVLLLYTVMIGAGVSALRALIMFLVRIGADITGRDYDLPTSLALSAAILCAVQPLNLLDAGFQLSFGAILGISLFHPVFSEMFGCAGLRETVRQQENAGSRPGLRFLLKIFEGLSTSMAVNVLLMGPLLYFYFEIPPYSVILNLIVIPVMPLAMGAGILGSGLALLWDRAGGVVLKFSGAVLFFYDRVCGAASVLPGSRIVTGQPDTGWLVIYYGILAFFCIFFFCLQRKKKAVEGAVEKDRIQQDPRYRRCRRMMRLTGGAVLLFAVAMIFSCRSGYTGSGVQVTVLDVGQGDGIFIRGPSGENYFVDGGSSSVSSVGTYRIEPFLLSQAAECIEYAFVTHGDEDHVNGILELLENQELGIRIRTLVLPAEEYLDETLLGAARTARENSTRVVTMDAGAQIREKEKGGEQELVLTCLGPSGAGKAGNAASLVLDLSYGAFDMLFTGDVEGQGEKALLESGRLRQYDVLKAAHHGSKNSGSEEFLAVVKPLLTIISAGVDNRYGHPHEETLDRLAQAGSEVCSTQEQGAVTIRTDGIKMTVKPAIPLVKPGAFPI